MPSELSIGTVVALTKDGAEYGLEGSCEVVTGYTYKDDDDRPFRDMREFFVPGATGTVMDVRDGFTSKEYLVRFDDDTVEDRAWWMMPDEVEVK